MDPRARSGEVSRTSDPDLFGLVIGGYGLFGVVTSVRLRLAPRRILRRIVTLMTVDELMDRFDDRIADGFLFGDCQFSIDERSPDFLRVGIFSCYGPDADGDRRSRTASGRCRGMDWGRLLYLTHTDRAAAAEAYVTHYTGDLGPALLVGPPPAERVHRRLPRGCSTG